MNLDNSSKPAVIGRLSAGVQRRMRIGLETLMILATGLFIAFASYNALLALPVTLILAAISLARLWFEAGLQRVSDWLFRWRWAAALIVFAFMVLFQLHFSSAATYGQIVTPDASVADSILFGRPQIIRSDEYAVQLPYYFSQAWNGYQQISHQMSLSGQDMILGYNAPVFSISLIGKPFVWGYLLFGNTYGLSWYFSSKLIGMFMISIEAFRILLGRNRKKLPVLAACVLTFSPAMQWWFSPHFFDVVFWSFTLFVVGYWFFVSKGWRQWGFVLLAIASLTGFILALFPSLQISLGLLMLALLAGCLWRDRQSVDWNWRLLGPVGAVLAGLAAVLIPTLLSMKDGLDLLMHTAYPGDRAVTGGYGSLQDLFLNISNPLLPFLDAGVENNSELATFTHFGLAFVLFFPWLWKALKQKPGERLCGLILLLAMALQAAFLLVPFPEWLARLTLLSYVNRMDFVFGLSAALFTFWSLAMLESVQVPHSLQVGAGVSIVYGILSLLAVKGMLYEPLVAYFHGPYVFYALALILAFGLWLAFTPWKGLFYTGLLCWSAVAGLCVNPLMQGSAAITDYPFVRAVEKEVQTNPDALWLSADEDQIQGLLLANGARVFNAVSFYPDTKKWELLDPDRNHVETENRYAHLEVSLKDGGTPDIELGALDLIRLRLPVQDLKALGIRYVSGDQDEKQLLDQKKVPYRLVFEDAENGDIIAELLE